jgi:hypothetical protein
VNASVSDYMHWIGTWAGVGETQVGQKTLIRQTFKLAMDGTGIEMHFEAFDPALSVMYHGVRSVLASAPSGVLRALAYSTIHGPLLLELMPDDEGVMALSGDSQDGNRISVTFVEESADELLFTAFWRGVDEPVAGKDAPRMTCRLERSQPWKPDARG